MIEPKYQREIDAGHREMVIEETGEVLMRFWAAHPELRLGQIVANAAKIANDIDPFFLDDAWLAYALGVMEAQYQMSRESADPSPS